MKKILRTIDGKITRIETPVEGCWIALTNPEYSLLEEISAQYSIDIDHLKAALDEEERARIEVEDNYTLILVDIPVVEQRKNQVYHVTMPLSIIITEEIIFTVCLRDTPILEDFMDGKVKNFFTTKKTRFILQMLYKNAQYFLQYLRVIDKRSNMIERELHISTKNKELIELLELEKSLVYFTTSLRSNEAVLERMLRIESIKQYPEDKELLEDVIIENKQAMEMGDIYSGILSGTMDAFASVISNNLNIVMKMLAGITIIMSIPTIIASFFGMNVMGGMPFQNNPYGFSIIIGITVLVALVTFFVMMRKKML
ncbi:MAG: magnesium transporter [Clostridiales bacterium]|jgi:magnesium transporter|nr:magnesium transporter [Clostridiales bacterium]